MPTTAPELSTAITNFAELRTRACQAGPKRVGVVLADDDVALTAASDALLLGIAFPCSSATRLASAPMPNPSACANSPITLNSSARLMPPKLPSASPAKAASTS